jgi:hypothetical protein
MNSTQINSGRFRTGKGLRKGGIGLPAQFQNERTNAQGGIMHH